MIKAEGKNILRKMKLSVEERKKHVIGLHKRGYTNREIARRTAYVIQRYSQNS